MMHPFGEQKHGVVGPSRVAAQAIWSAASEQNRRAKGVLAPRVARRCGFASGWVVGPKGFPSQAAHLAVGIRLVTSSLFRLFRIHLWDCS